MILNIERRYVTELASPPVPRKKFEIIYHTVDTLYESDKTYTANILLVCSNRYNRDLKCFLEACSSAKCELFYKHMIELDNNFKMIYMRELSPYKTLMFPLAVIFRNKKLLVVDFRSGHVT